jgi:hypothetical protein
MLDVLPTLVGAAAWFPGAIALGVVVILVLVVTVTRRNRTRRRGHRDRWAR